MPWRRERDRLPTPVFLPGEFHGQRSLMGYSPWGCKEPDMTEWITLSKCIAIYLLGHVCHGFSRTFTQSRTETGEKRTGQKLEKNDIAQGHDTGWLEANRSKMSSLTGGLEPQYTITVTCAHTQDTYKYVEIWGQVFNKYVEVWGIPGCSDAKESAHNAGDLGSVPGLGRFLGEGNVYPLQYSCLQNPMDRGYWQAVIHGVAKSWTWLSN